MSNIRLLSRCEGKVTSVGKVSSTVTMKPTMSLKWNRDGWKVSDTCDYLSKECFAPEIDCDRFKLARHQVFRFLIILRVQYDWKWIDVDCYPSHSGWEHLVGQSVSFLFLHLQLVHLVQAIGFTSIVSGIISMASTRSDKWGSSQLNLFFVILLAFRESDTEKTWMVAVAFLKRKWIKTLDSRAMKSVNHMTHLL